MPSLNMSTIISAHRRGSPGRFLGALLGILAVWFALLAAVPVIRDAPGRYLVLGPQAPRFAALQSTSAELISSGPGYTQIAAASSGQIGRLYANGAWLVLPAGNGGCLRLDDRQAPQAR
jgi:hypothetical protein